MDVVALGKRTLKEFSEDDCATLAQSIAYAAFFSLFPLLLAAAALMGYVVSDPATRDKIMSGIYANLPASGSFIGETLKGMQEKRGTATIISLLLLLWSGSGVFKSTIHALDRAFETPSERGIVGSTILAFELIFGVGGLMILSLAITAVIQALASISILGYGPYTDSLILTPIQFVLSFLVSLAMFTLLYKWAPNMQVTWREAAAGAVVAAFLFEVAKLGFVVYAKNFMGADAYGAIGGVIVLLTWSYFSSLILLLGAEVSSEYHKTLAEAKAPTHQTATVGPRPGPIMVAPAQPAPFGERLVAIGGAAAATVAAFAAVMFSRNRPSGQV